MISQDLLDLLACPKCKGGLHPETVPESLVCPVCALRYPIRDGIPVMLIDEAERL